MSRLLATAVDDLYREVVFDPERWRDDAFADWMAGLVADGTPLDREAARAVRRAVRIAVKLQRFWSSEEADRYRDESSWEARVDLAVGIPAWRPGLDLAEQELARRPSPEAFDDVRTRFRVVNGVPWMDDIDYDTWITRYGDDITG